MLPHTKKGNQRHWTVKIYDAQDQLQMEKSCSTLTEVAQIFGLNQACDMSHFLYGPKDAAKRLMPSAGMSGLPWRGPQRSSQKPS